METLEVVGSKRTLYALEATYAEAHDAAVGMDNEIQFIIESGYNAGGPYYVVQRGFLAFDTSALGPRAKIRSAVLTLTISSYSNGLFHVVQGLEGGANVSANFGTLKDKTTSGGSGSGSGSISITLNATGRSWISKAGITNLGLRIAGDIDNITPTGDEYYIFTGNVTLTIEYLTIAGNPNIDQLIYQHAERMERFR